MKKLCWALVFALLLTLFTGCAPQTAENPDSPAAEAAEPPAAEEAEDAAPSAEETPAAPPAEAAEPAQSAEPVTLRMAAWMQSPQLTNILQLYQQLHPEIQIEATYFYDPQAGDDFEASITRVAAELLVNKDFDLYALNSLNVTGLRNAGLLADLRPYMAADESFREEDYLMHIWNLFDVSGSLYQFVPCFGIYGLYGPQSVLGNRRGWTYEEFEAAQSAFTGDVPFVGIDRNGYLSRAIQQTMHQFIDVNTNSCAFETETFYRWMEFIKNFDGMMSLTSPLNAVLPISNLSIYYQFVTDAGETVIITGVPGETAEGPAVMAQDTFAISSMTEHPDQCWAFLMYLMEDAPQQILSGFRMRRDLMEQELAAAMLPNDEENALFYGWTDENNEPLPSLTEETVAYLRELIDSLDYVRFSDEDVIAIVTEEVSSYFSEPEFTAQEVAARIQDRVSTYLEEAKEQP